MSAILGNAADPIDVTGRLVVVAADCGSEVSVGLAESDLLPACCGSQELINRRITLARLLRDMARIAARLWPYPTFGIRPTDKSGLGEAA